MKRRAAGASGSDHPTKKLREDHGTSGDAGASTGGKSLAALQGLLERSTLAAEVGVTPASTVPFVTSPVTPTPEREGGGNTDYVSGPNLHAEVTSLVRSFVSPPLVMTAAVTTTNVAGASSAPVLEAGAEPVSQVHLSIFADSASIGAAGPDVAATRVSELNSLKERNSFLEEEKNALEGKVTTLESAATTKETELADGFADEVSLLETTYSGLRDQVSGYELFKEQCEAIQDEQVKALSGCVAGLDSELMAMALHLDEEFYPYTLTTIVVIGLASDKGIQAGLVAGIDHGKAERGLADVASYDPFVEASLLCLEGPSAETPEVRRLQPLYEQFLLPVHRKEDNVVIGETSLSDSLDVVHARV
ncbi:hypothetical protein Tco_0099307 [Tanacetum coccineum]